MANKKTKKPTGLAITRNGSKFKCTWKIAAKNHNDGQDFAYNVDDVKYKKGKKKGKLKWTDVNIGKKTTSHTVTIDLKKYYPNTTNKLKTVRFKVRGNQDADKNDKWTMSDWSDYKMDIKAPPKPAISAEHTSTYNVTKYAWGLSENQIVLNSQPYQELEVWTILVPRWNKSGGDKVPDSWWNNSKYGGKLSTKSYQGEWNTPEDSALFYAEGYSYTRCFRVRSKGAGGYSAWNYAHHTYARPPQIKNAKARLSKKTGVGYILQASWSATDSYDYPIDKVETMYGLAHPPVSSSSVVTDSNGRTTRVFSISCPNDSGMWTKSLTLADTTYSDAVVLSINHSLNTDECVYFRANTVHDDVAVEGVPVLAANGAGYLADPVVKQMIINPNTHRVQVQAENKSSVSESYLVFYYRSANNPKDYKAIGILPHGVEEGTFQLPTWETGEEFSIGCRALLANYSPATPKELGIVTEYAISSPIMASESIKWDEGRVPMPPAIDLTSPSLGNILVKWNWSWNEANQAEISWAKDRNAWESTDEPTTFIVNNLFASQWIISGLDIGEWWVRVRLLKASGDTTVYGIYSDPVSIKLSSAPDIPSLMIPESVVTDDGTITCYWVYTTNDGTPQLGAKIYEADIDEETGEITYHDQPVAKTSTAQQLTLNVKQLGWATGSTHYLCVTVTSASHEDSLGFSPPVAVVIADKPEISSLTTSLSAETVQVEDSEDITEITDYYLTDMPLQVSAIGAGPTGITRVIIERAEDYQIIRPDGRDLDGYAGETIFNDYHDGETEFVIYPNDNAMQGSLDDGAKYNLIVEVSDEYKQLARETIPFMVRWTDQAVRPDATVEIREDERIAIITIAQPAEGYHEGDTCDIYRLSADRPELIYEGAQFGVPYVDPYPAIGPNGGHRIVYVTKNGDYIAGVDTPTSGQSLAWLDIEGDDDILRTFGIIIDFELGTIILPYNVSLSNQWKKSFTKTSYLGGSVIGDWNDDVERTLSANTVSIVEEDMQTIRDIRLLADYPGECHIRTPDGSSFAANIDVSEDREEKMINKLAKFRLNVTRIDSEGFDGMTLEAWRKSHPLVEQDSGT